jgi:glutamate mutase epsilon subunit
MLAGLNPALMEAMQRQSQGTVSAAVLPSVSDPEKAYAELTRQEYLDYIANYRNFEEQLINKAQTDTSLIDQAREDVGVAQTLTQGVANRNAQRYGVALTPAQIQQQQLRLQRANTLGGVQAINDARIAQRESNTQLLADLINIGQGVNRSSQQQLGSAAADATQRRNAYTQAKAASKANTYATVGSLASAAILAFAF